MQQHDTDWRSQPHAIVERDGVTYTLLGTAHVSQSSVDAVRAAIASGQFDAVAVELDEQRLRALSDPQALANVDLVKVIREGKTALFAANLGLAAYQRRLAEQLGIQPGAELKAAVDDARARGLPAHLIDRDVGLTFRRTSEKLGFWQRSKILAGILTSLFIDEKLEDDAIEKLKQGDMLEASFSEFAKASPQLYEGVIAERDRYMAARLRQQAGSARNVLAVIGAGHLTGTAGHLRDAGTAPAATIAELEALKPKSGIPWFTLFLAAFVLGGFAWGFATGGVDVGRDLMLAWVLLTAGLGALGCAIAGGHPLSILGAAVASPLTPLHPALASGMVSGLIETWLRKPTHADFMALREDVQSVRGWYRNRVSRILLVFFCTNLGTVLGVWLGGARMLRRLVA
ncbi:MAG: TraB/GumN family protein [Pseudoxanthomonas suwonensis]|nr:TraB/GumN family protein [Pseudoxanthomonas suwonensis]